ncbi:biotin--[acetyl-CoA-carboxylase] ligase, partial [Pseudomonadota bacterium]
HWIATPFTNLLMSVGWVYESWPRDITGLSVAVGISLIEAIRSLDIDGLGMKWPNDLVIDGKKTGGILIEVSGESTGRCTVVVGLGINVRMGGDDGRSIDQPWTDLETVRGQAVNRNELAAACLSALCRMLQAFPKAGFEPWRIKWADVDVLTGETVSITTHQNGVSTEGVVTGLDTTGALLVDVKGQGIRSLLSGEVSVRAR